MSGARGTPRYDTRSHSYGYEQTRPPESPARQEYSDRGARDMETGRIERKLDVLAGEVQEVKVLVAGMMPRAEVDAEIGRRVSLEVYTADQHATNDRLIRLESSSTRFLAWASGGVGCLAVLVSMASAGFLVLEFILTHYKP